MAYKSSNCVELFLCISLGFLGAHKFYTGNWKCGIFYLLTVGFAFIGVCIDIFLILYFWKEDEEEIMIANALKGRKAKTDKEKLLLYTSANDSIINYKYTANKGKTACASASGLCLWIFLVIVVSVIIFYIWPFIDPNYFEEDYGLEYYEKYYAKYSNRFQISETEFTVDNADRRKKYNKIKLFYPTELENKFVKNFFPVVLISNPLGVPYSKYESVFKHLASFGFVAVGNDGIGGEDKNLPNIIDELSALNGNHATFKNKLNLNEMGVIGYYQGSSSVISLLNNFPYNNLIAASYVSCLKDYNSDKEELLNKVKNISSPIFLSGPGKGSDYDGIMKEIAEILKDKIEFHSLLRRNKEEGKMIIYGDAYMTAWFDYKLKRNENGTNIFKKYDGEIYNNTNWFKIEDKLY